jgi:hypothetical protein
MLFATTFVYIIKSSADGASDGRWQDAVTEAIAATEESFPGREVVCYLDKKSFKGGERQELIAYLDKLGRRWALKAEDI